MIESWRRMPAGVVAVTAFGLLLLGGLGLTLPLVVDQAVEAPVSPIGLLWMLLIAYVVFTLTLILQRKQAGWGLSVGLASLALPLTLILWVWAGAPGVLAGVVVGTILFVALRSPRSREWFSQR